MFTGNIPEDVSVSLEAVELSAGVRFVFVEGLVVIDGLAFSNSVSSVIGLERASVGQLV